MNKVWRTSLIVFVLVFLIQISLVSALNFDNVKGNLIIDETTSKYGKIEIKDWFGLLDLATLELKENTNHCISSCSAETEIIMYKTGILIDEVKFMELQSDKKWIEKPIVNYKFYIRSEVKEIIVDDYIEKCSEKETLNKTKYTDCIKVKDGTHIEYENIYEEYILGSEVEAGTYYVKLEGKKDPHKTVDWIITSQGKLINDWAMWASSLDVNLISYYDMGDASGGITDIHGSNDGVENGNPTYGATGIIGNAIDFDGAGDSFTVGDVPFDITNKLSISFWIKPSDLDGNQVPISKSYLIYEVLIKDTSYSFYLNGVDINTVVVPVASVWQHVVITFDENGGSDNKIIYINGTSRATATVASAITTGNEELTFGTRGGGTSDYNGLIDEVGIWDRILSPSEVEDLYNSGVGITYGLAFDTTLNSPVDYFNSSISSVVFNCTSNTASEGGETIQNISLWLNITGIWILNETKTYNGNVQEHAVFTKNIPEGINLEWTCQGFDNITSSWAINRTFTIDTIYPLITINLPTSLLNYGYQNKAEDLNWSASDANFGSVWYTYNGTNTTLNGLVNTTTFNISNSPFNLTLWVNDTVGNTNSSYVGWNYKIFNNGETYNDQTYETSSETFSINVTANSSLTAVNLIYSGTEYIGANLGSGIWSKTLNIPLGSSNKNFYWNFTYAGEQISSTTHTQTVNYTHLVLCNATYTVPYINFTFKDEASSAIINASVDLATFDYWLGSGAVTKEYIFQNTTDNFNYAFCFTPADKSLTIDVDFKYSKTGYPQRTHTYDNKVLTNSTTTKILYLLSSTDGIYSTIQFLDAATNNPISGVEVTAEREILGTWTLINQGVTDAAGAITFWVNPDYEHRITATKTGYANVQETIVPTQTSYTIFMGTSATVSIPGYRYKNIKYITYPPAGRLIPNTIYTFGFNITADEGNIVSCRIDIKNLTLSTVATSSIGCGAYGGNVSVSYNVGTNSKLFGYYYVDIGDGLELFKANDAWYVEFLNTTSTGGLISFFESLGDLPEWGDTHNRQEFSKITFFFFIMILTIGIFTFFSGYELSSPGAALILVWAFVAFGTVSGIIGIEGLTSYDWWNKYVYFIIVSFLFFGFVLNKIRRDNM